VSSEVLVLASGSASRQAMLRAAGVAFEPIVPHVDEEAVKEALLADRQPARAVADALAELKALRISARVPEAVVLGADQVLVCDGQLYNKAADLSAARAVLKELRGKQHQLITAAVLARAATPIWRHVETAELWMRDFSDAFLDRYLAEVGESVLGAVGCYHIEGAGVQLFDRVAGDHFAIRGLPLLPLLAALRAQNLVAA
jgi:septum formation protein